MLMTQYPKTRTIEKLKDGLLPRADRDNVPKFPSFMYDEDMVEPGKVTSGLFRGPLLVAASFSPLGLHSLSLTESQVYKHIFISKSIARGEEGTARRGVAQINQMENVEPATICYTVLQVCEPDVKLQCF